MCPYLFSNLTEVCITIKAKPKWRIVVRMNRVIIPIIIYMKKIMQSDWLREVQYFGNTVQKRGYWMQKMVIKQAFWLVNEQRSSQIANQMRAVDGASWIDKMADRFGENARVAMFSLKVWRKLQNKDYKGRHKQLDNESFEPVALNKIVGRIFKP